MATWFDDEPTAEISDAATPVGPALPAIEGDNPYINAYQRGIKNGLSSLQNIPAYPGIPGVVNGLGQVTDPSGGMTLEELDQYNKNIVDQNAVKTDAPTDWSPVAGLKVLGNELNPANVWTHAKATAARAFEDDNRWTHPADWRTAAIDESNALTEEQRKYAEDTATQAAAPGKVATLLPGLMPVKDIGGLGGNLTFSGAGMTGAALGQAAGRVVGGVLGGAAASLAGPEAVPAGVRAGQQIGGWAAGLLGAGKVAYDQQYQMFLENAHDQLNKQSLKETGKPLNNDDWNKIFDNPVIQKAAKDSALWEAGPQAVGDMLFLKIAGMGLARNLSDGAVKRALKAAGALTGQMLTEQTTETITQHGQNNAEVDAGLKPESERRSWTSPADIKKSYDEVATQTALMTLIMGGAGHVGGKAYERFIQNPKDADTIVKMAENANLRSALPDVALDNLTILSEHLQGKVKNNDQLAGVVESLKAEQLRRQNDAGYRRQQEEMFGDKADAEGNVVPGFWTKLAQQKTQPFFGDPLVGSYDSEGKPIGDISLPGINQYADQLNIGDIGLALKLRDTLNQADNTAGVKKTSTTDPRVARESAAGLTEQQLDESGLRVDPTLVGNYAEPIKDQSVLKPGDTVLYGGNTHDNLFEVVGRDPDTGLLVLRDPTSQDPSKREFTLPPDKGVTKEKPNEVVPFKRDLYRVDVAKWQKAVAADRTASNNGLIGWGDLQDLDPVTFDNFRRQVSSAMATNPELLNAQTPRWMNVFERRLETVDDELATVAQVAPTIGMSVPELAQVAHQRRFVDANQQPRTTPIPLADALAEVVAERPAVSPTPAAPAAPSFSTDPTGSGGIRLRGPGVIGGMQPAPIPTLLPNGLPGLSQGIAIPGVSTVVTDQAVNTTAPALPLPAPTQFTLNNPFTGNKTEVITDGGASGVLDMLRQEAEKQRQRAAAAQLRQQAAAVQQAAPPVLALPAPKPIPLHPGVMTPAELRDAVANGAALNPWEHSYPQWQRIERALGVEVPMTAEQHQKSVQDAVAANRAVPKSVKEAAAPKAAKPPKQDGAGNQKNDKPEEKSQEIKDFEKKSRDSKLNYDVDIIPTAGGVVSPRSMRVPKVSEIAKEEIENDKNNGTNNWGGTKGSAYALDKLAADGVPAFQGNKYEHILKSFTYIRFKLKKVVSAITVIHDYFGGGGGWGLAIADRVATNAKELNLYELNPNRALKIQLFLQDGMTAERFEEIAKQLLDTNEGVQGVINTLTEKGTFSSKSLSIEMDNLLKNNPASEEETRAVLQAIVDQGAAGMGTPTSVEKAERESKSAVLYMNAVKNIMPSIRGMQATLARIRQTRPDFKVNIQQANSYEVERQTGAHVLSVFDPPYYNTLGYNGVDKVPLSVYQQTEQALLSAKQAGNHVIYTDEAWWTDNTLPTDMAGDGITGRTAHEIYESIRSEIPLAIQPIGSSYQERYEVLGVYANETGAAALSEQSPTQRADSAPPTGQGTGNTDSTGTGSTSKPPSDGVGSKPPAKGRKPDAGPGSVNVKAAIDLDNDDILRAIAKSGGLHGSLRGNLGLDANFNKSYGPGLWLFTSDGATIDLMAEHLSQFDYPVFAGNSDVTGTYQYNDGQSSVNTEALSAAISDAINNGAEIYTLQGSEKQADKAQQRDYENQQHEKMQEHLATPPMEFSAQVGTKLWQFEIRPHQPNAKANHVYTDNEIGLFSLHGTQQNAPKEKWPQLGEASRELDPLYERIRKIANGASVIADDILNPFPNEKGPEATPSAPDQTDNTDADTAGDIDLNATGDTNPDWLNEGETDQAPPAPPATPVENTDTADDEFDAAWKNRKSRRGSGQRTGETSQPPSTLASPPSAQQSPAERIRQGGRTAASEAAATGAETLDFVNNLIDIVIPKGTRFNTGNPIVFNQDKYEAMKKSFIAAVEHFGKTLKSIAEIVNALFDYIVEALKKRGLNDDQIDNTIDEIEPYARQFTKDYVAGKIVVADTKAEPEAPLATIDSVLSQRGVTTEVVNDWTWRGEPKPTVVVRLPSRDEEVNLLASDANSRRHFDKDSGFYPFSRTGERQQVYAAGPFKGKFKYFVEHVFNDYLDKSVSGKVVSEIAKRMANDVQYRQAAIREGLAYALAKQTNTAVERGAVFNTGNNAGTVSGSSDAVLERLREQIRGLVRSTDYRSQRVAPQSRTPEDYRGQVDRGTVELIERGLKAGIPQSVIDWQVEDIGRALVNLNEGKPAFMLSSDPGSGKTFTIGGFIRDALASDSKARVLYFTNSNPLIDQIRNQDLRDYGINEGRVDLITYARIQNASNARIVHSGNTSTIEFDQGKTKITVDKNTILVFDESHKVKNILDEGTGSVNASELMRRAKFSFYSSATPFETPSEANYLANSGLFNEYDDLARQQGLSYKEHALTGFQVWAIEHGANLRQVEDKDGNKKLVVAWGKAPRFTQDQTITPAEQQAAIREFENTHLEYMLSQMEQGQEARQWFIDRNLLTHRPINLGTLPNGKAASVTHLTPVESEQAFYEDVYNPVVAVFDAAMADPSEEAVYLKSTIMMQRENAKKRMAELAKLKATAELVKRDLKDPSHKAVVFVKVKSPMTFGRAEVWDDVTDETGEKRILTKITKAIDGERRDIVQAIARGKFKDNAIRAAGALNQLKKQIAGKKFNADEMDDLNQEWGAYLGAIKTDPDTGATTNLGLFSSYSQYMARAFMDAGMSDLKLDSPITTLRALLEPTFGKGSVVEYSGSLDDKKNFENREAWKQSGTGPRIMIATMDKGGTGLSLHDLDGKRQSFQYNVAIPYTATEFEQVSGRIARYGLQSQANVYWLFANNMPDQFDFRWAKILQERLNNQQAVVKGNVTETTRNLTAENVLGRAQASRSATKAAGLSRAEFMPAIRKHFAELGRFVEKTLKLGEQGYPGGLVLIDSAEMDEIAKVFAEKTGRTIDEAVKTLKGEKGILNGLYDPRSGLTFAVLPNLSATTAVPVILHEAIHGTANAKLLQAMIDAAYAIVQRRSKTAGPMREYLDAVYARLSAAKAVNDPREYPAYMVEVAAEMGRKNGFNAADGRFLDWVDAKIGKSVGDFVRRVVNMIRAAMFKMGVPLKQSNLTVDDLIGFAKASVMRASRGEARTSEADDVNFSRKSVSQPRFMDEVTNEDIPNITAQEWSAQTPKEQSASIKKAIALTEKAEKTARRELAKLDKALSAGQKIYRRNEYMDKIKHLINTLFFNDIGDRFEVRLTSATKVPDVLRGRVLRASMDNQDVMLMPPTETTPRYIVDEQLLEVKPASKIFKAVRSVLPIAGDKSSVVTNLSKLIDKVFPDLDQNTDEYHEPFGGGLLYLNNLEVLRNTEKPIYISVSRKHGPERYAFYHLLKNNKNGIGDQIVSDLQKALETGVLPKHKIVRYAYNAIYNSKTRSNQIINNPEVLREFTAMLRKGNVFLSPNESAVSYAQAAQAARSGRRITLIDDSNYARLFAENPENQYPNPEKDDPLDPQYQLDSKRKVYDAVRKNNGHVIATNNMSIKMIQGLVDAYGDNLNLFGFRHAARHSEDTEINFYRPTGGQDFIATARPEYVALIGPQRPNGEVINNVQILETGNITRPSRTGRVRKDDDGKSQTSSVAGERRDYTEGTGLLSEPTGGGVDSQITLDSLQDRQDGQSETEAGRPGVTSPILWRAGELGDIRATGIFLSIHKDTAAQYQTTGKGGKALNAYTLRDGLKIKETTSRWALVKELDKTWDKDKIHSRFIKAMFRAGGKPIDGITPEQRLEAEAEKRIKKILSKQGYDGVHYLGNDGTDQNGEYQIFDSKNISVAPSVPDTQSGESSPRYSRTAATAEPATEVQAQAVLRKLVGSKEAAALINSGRVVIHSNTLNLTDQERNDRIGAYIDEKGNIHLVLPFLSADLLNDLLDHESAHLGAMTGYSEGDLNKIKLVNAVLRISGLSGLIGKPGFEDMIAQINRLADNGVEAAVRARQMVDNLIATGKLDEADRDHELLAYTTEYAPKNLPIYRRIIAAVRAALYRVGVKINLTEADLTALARGALREQARAVMKYGDLRQSPASLAYAKQAGEGYATADEAISALESLTPVSPEYILSVLGEYPDYLKEVGNFIVGQFDKLRKGELSVRDVAKGYFMTAASQGSSASGTDTAIKALTQAGYTPESNPTHPFSLFTSEYKASSETKKQQFINSQDTQRWFAGHDLQGIPMIRPEEFAAWWLGTTQGQRALDAVEAKQPEIYGPLFAEFGKVRSVIYGRDPLGGMSVYGKTTVVKMPPGTKTANGAEKLSDTAITPENYGKTPPGAYNIGNIHELTKAINATRGDFAKLEAVLKKAKTVKDGKVGFMGHFVGMGTIPTSDAVEWNFMMTGEGNISQMDASKNPNVAFLRLAKDSSFPLLSTAMAKLVRDQIAQIAPLMAEKYAMPRVAVEHIIHHWIWDKAKGISTTHEGLYTAMRRYSRTSNNAVVDDESAANTQIDSTMGSYSAVARNILSLIPGLKTVLDYGAGKGRGTASIQRVFNIANSGVAVESLEPFPRNWAGLGNGPNYTDETKVPDNSKDAVVNLNVLNVVGKETRDSIVSNIGRILTPGGIAVISSRRWKGDVDTIKPGSGLPGKPGSVPGDEPNSFFVTRSVKNKETGKSQLETNYQKGIEPDELVDYISEMLPGFTVVKLNGYGASGVVIQKPGDRFAPLETILKKQKKASVGVGTEETAEIRKLAKTLGAPSRDSFYGVGKRMGDELYFHRQYIDSLPAVDRAVIDDANNQAGDFAYNLVRYNIKTGEVAFFNSPDFDTANEPVNGPGISVQPDGTNRPIAFNADPDNQPIYHHKWLWVKDDYTGFSVVESINRSIAWQEAANAVGVNRKRIGYKGVWRKEMIPLMAGINPDIRLSRTQTPPTSGVSASSVAEKLITPKAALWRHAGLEVKVVRSVSEIPETSRPDDAETSEGFYDPKSQTVYLIADNLVSMKRAQQVLRHEIIGHYASLMLRDTVEWNGILRNIHRLEQMGNAQVVSAAALVDKNQKNLKDNPARRQEEIFAVLVERDEHNQIGVLRGLVDRILLRLKEWLNRLGMDSNWINNRTFNEVMAWARQSESGLASGKLVRGPWNAVGMEPGLRDSIAAIAMIGKSNNSEPTTAELAEAKRQYDGVVAKYKGTDQWLKAPNGQPTKLNERQWVMVQTENFKKWFDGSKVVDENGEPLVVYHGGSFNENTHGIPDTQGKPKKGWQLIFGMHFTDDKSQAIPYVKKNGVVTEAFVRSKNLLYLSPEKDENGKNIWHPITDDFYNSIPANLKKRYDNFLKTTKYTDDRGYTEWLEGSIDKMKPADAKEAISAMGFDGVFYTAKANHGGGRYHPFSSYIAFEPSQIKSAIGNVGTFGETADIRYSRTTPRDLSSPPVARKTFDEIGQNLMDENPDPKTWDRVWDAARNIFPATLGVLTRQQLVEMAGRKITALGRALLPSAEFFENAAALMDGVKSRIKREMYDGLIESLQRELGKSRKLAYEFDFIIHGSTLRQVDPTQPMREQYETETDAAYAEKVEWHTLLTKKLRDLEKQSPVLADAVGRMFRNYVAVNDMKYAAMKERVGRSGFDMVRTALERVKGMAPEANSVKDVQAIMAELKAATPEDMKAVNKVFRALARVHYIKETEQYRIDSPIIPNDDPLANAAKEAYQALTKEQKTLFKARRKLAQASHAARLFEFKLRDPDNYEKLTQLMTSTMRRTINILVDRVSQKSFVPEEQAAMRQELKKLPEDAQNLFVDMNRTYKVRQSNMMSSIDLYQQAARSIHPYAPLSRFGKYEVFAERMEPVIDKETGKPKVGVDGSPLMERKIGFTKLETIHDQKQAAKHLKATGWTVSTDYQIIRDRINHAPSGTFIGEMFGFIDDSVANPKERDALKESMYQMYLENLPDLSVRKHLLKRSGVPGYNRDAIRGYGQFMNGSANMIARLRFSDVLSEQLYQMEEEVTELSGHENEQGKAGAILNELIKSYDWLMNPSNATWANRMTALGFVWYLTNPSTALINLSQIPLMTFPALAAKFTSGSAFKQIHRAMKDYARVINRSRQMGWNPLNPPMALKTSRQVLDANGQARMEVKFYTYTDEKAYFKAIKDMEAQGFTVDRAVTTLEAAIMETLGAEYNGDMARFLEFLERSGRIERSATTQLAGLGEDSWQHQDNLKGKFSRLANGTLKVGAFLFHHSEVANREVTALAAYRLMREKLKNLPSEKAHQEAQEYAFKAVALTQGDYSNANRSRITRGDWMRVLTLFKTYAQMMTWRMLRDFKQTIGKDVDPTERQEARERLGWMMMNTILLGGAMSLPIYSLVVGLMNAAGDDDPDDPWDFEMWMQQQLGALLGDTGRRVVMTGPVGAMTGTALSQRLSLDIWRMWVRKVPGDLEGTALVNAYAQQALGPAFGMIFRAGQGVKDMSHGIAQNSTDLKFRGAEALLPAPLANLTKAWRFMTEGVQTRRGDKLTDDLTGTQIASQIVGFQPASLFEIYQQNDMLFNEKSQLERRARDLISGYVYAVENHDDEARLEKQREIAQYNATNPRIRIKPQQIQNMIKQRRIRDRASQGGMYVPSRAMRQVLNESRYIED